MTVERINLLEKDHWVLTYQWMAILAGGLLGFCLLLYGILFLQSHRLQGRMDTLNLAIAQLNTQREKILSASDNPETGLGPSGEIRAWLSKGISWHSLMTNLSQRLPPNVWLDTIKSFAKQESSSGVAMVMHGHAREAEGLSAFLADLKTSPHFSQVVLTQSKQTDGLFNFSLECWVVGK